MYYRKRYIRISIMRHVVSTYILNYTWYQISISFGRSHMLIILFFVVFHWSNIIFFHVFYAHILFEIYIKSSILIPIIFPCNLLILSKQTFYKRKWIIFQATITKSSFILFYSEWWSYMLLIIISVEYVLCQYNSDACCAN